MAKVKYYAKENSTIGTHSFYAVPIKQVKAKQLRNFIKSHEMRYFVEHSDYGECGAEE